MLVSLTAAAVLAFLPAPTAVTPTAQPAGARACAGAYSQGDAARETHAIRCLLNIERSRMGLVRLRSSGKLQTAARRHARDMVRRDFFDHTSPGGSTPARRAKRAGYPGRRIGETIAWGVGSWSTAAGTVSRWMGSAGHRRAILDPGMRDLGVGVASGSPLAGERGGETVTADFGSR